MGDKISFWNMLQVLKIAQIYYLRAGSSSPYYTSKVDCLDRHWYSWISASLRSGGIETRSQTAFFLIRNTEHVPVQKGFLIASHQEVVL